jgi:hypothetical protein
MAQLQQPNNEQPVKQPPKFVTLSSLRPGTEGYNLIVKVTEVIPVVDKVRRDGTRMRVALIVIADQDASVVFVGRGGMRLIYALFIRLILQTKLRRCH